MYYDEYDFMHGIDGGLVAAYQESLIEVSYDPKCASDSACTYTYYLNDKPIVENSRDRSVEYTFDTVGPYVVKVVSSSGASSMTTVMCRYIRHEIRVLSEEDVKAYFDAVHTVYTVLEEEGKMIYGEDYRDAGYFINYHTWMAGDMECDHLHDGMGFITGHNAISLEFEKVLRSVNAAVSIPYWDYTVDMHNVKDAGEDMSFFYKSVVFGENWFGPMGSAAHHYVVVGGQTTAYLSLDPSFYHISAEDAKVTNAYGLLRSPWNLLDTPYLTRANTTYGFYTDYEGAPRCSEFYHAINAKPGFFDFTRYAQANCHGSIHTMIGGVYNTDWRQWGLDHDWPLISAKNAGLQGFGVWKRMWRNGDLVCPDDCTEDSRRLDESSGENDDTASSCACSCTFNVDEITRDEVEFYIHEYGAAFDYNTIGGDDIRREVLKLFCGQFGGQDRPYLGDAMNSGASADPSFWPTHPNIDRLFQWRVINGVEGDETWLNGDDSEHSFYWGGGPTERCWGHYPTDVMIWKNIFFNDEANKDHYYTAAELYYRLDPHKGYLSTMFDYFKWPQCEEEGYPLDLLGESAADDDGNSWDKSKTRRV